jgi:hypothetical protein
MHEADDRFKQVILMGMQIVNNNEQNEKNIFHKDRK